MMADDQAPEASAEAQELDAIMRQLAQMGTNVPLVLAQLVPRAKIEALIAALTAAGVVSKDALNVEYTPRLLALMRAALTQAEVERLAEVQAVQQARQEQRGVLVPEHVARGRKVN